MRNGEKDIDVPFFVGKTGCGAVSPGRGVRDADLSQAHRPKIGFVTTRFYNTDSARRSSQSRLPRGKYLIAALARFDKPDAQGYKASEQVAVLR